MTTAAASRSFYFLLGGFCPLGRALVGQGCGQPQARKPLISIFFLPDQNVQSCGDPAHAVDGSWEVSVAIRTPEEYDAVLSSLKPDKKPGKLLLARPEGAC